MVGVAGSDAPTSRPIPGSGVAGHAGRNLRVPLGRTGARAPATIVTFEQRKRILAAHARANGYARWPPPAPIPQAPQPAQSSTVVVPTSRIPNAHANAPQSRTASQDDSKDAETTPRGGTCLLPKNERRSQGPPTIDTTFLPSGNGSLLANFPLPAAVPSPASTATPASDQEAQEHRSVSTPSTSATAPGPSPPRSDPRSVALSNDDARVDLGDHPIPPVADKMMAVTYSSGGIQQTASPDRTADTTASSPVPTPEFKALHPDPVTLARLENRAPQPSFEPATHDGAQQSEPRFDSAPPGVLLRSRDSGRRSFTPAALANGVPLTETALAAGATAAVVEAAASARASTSPPTSASPVATPREISRFSTSTASHSLLSHKSSAERVGPEEGQATSEPPSAGTTSNAINTSPNHPVSATFSSDAADAPHASPVPLPELPSLPASAWAEVQVALDTFRQRSFKPAGTPTDPDRGDKVGPLRNVLLPFLQLELERPGVYPLSDGSAELATRANAHVRPERRRGLLFNWIVSLMVELPHVATSSDRGAVLESLAGLLESENLSPAALYADDARGLSSPAELDQIKKDQEQYYSLLARTVEFAIGEMNKKGVYQNTLIFSGRILAIALFRIEGVAAKLLHHLPINRFAIDRLADESGWAQVKPATDAEWDEYTLLFPPHLRPHCFRQAKSYLSLSESGARGKKRPTPGTNLGPGSSSGTPKQGTEDRYLINRTDVKVEVSGNWLRRWQSDDSELFFSFCRNFHRQLARLLYGGYRRGFHPPILRLRTEPRMVFGSPGFAHVNTAIHQKCLSLVMREIMSVTTLSSQKSPFNAGETANVLSASSTGKPRNLELANRRCSAIVVELVRVCGSQGLIFLPLIDTQIKTLFRRTSLWDVQGVFCLLDWADSLFVAVEGAEWGAEEVVDLSFVLDVVEMLLEKSDHAVTLMRTIAFAYSNFGLLISSKAHRMRFTEGILLKPAIFQKLFLSWSFLIRAYFLHLLVFRLGHLTDFPPLSDDPRNSSATLIAQLFNQRLDEIRERHDELSPDTTDSGPESEDEDDEDGKSRRRLSFVSTIKRTRSIDRSPSPDYFPASSDEEEPKDLDFDVDPQHPSVKSTASRAAKWLRSMRKTKGTKPSSDASPPVPAVPSPHGTPQKVADTAGSSTSSNVDSGLRRTPSSPAINGGTPMLERRSSSSSDRISFDATFDLQTPHTTAPAAPPGGPAPGRPASVRSSRVSRAFSKRLSLVPGPALDLVSTLGEDDDQSGSSERQSLFAPSLAGGVGTTTPVVGPNVARKPQSTPRYEPKLHVYAVQSLREYEQTIHEHDEFMGSQPEGERSVVPSLPVNWPALWNDSN